MKKLLIIACLFGLNFSAQIWADDEEEIQNPVKEPETPEGEVEEAPPPSDTNPPVVPNDGSAQN